MKRKPHKVARQRPAEVSGGVAGAVAALLAYALDITDPGVIAAMMVVVGAVPALVTWLVVTVRAADS